ncbi:MAG: DUF1080 domain-containing protein [Bacteroidales bacterium]|jgi:predicted small lipoprotein YifL|nr:DUF1080 domain-containing protein [Bacteroidales bacterium]
MKVKNVILGASALCLVFALASCGGSSSKKPAEAPAAEEKAAPAVPEYTVLEKPQVDLSTLAKDKDGYVILFDGKSMDGWRGYGRDDMPGKWSVDNGTLKFTGSGTGEGQEKDGGDVIFAHKFKNFEVSIDWKISKGGNSGIFYLAQEVQTKNDKGETITEPIYISSPESQVLDDANHPDAKLGENGNRMSSSLYDMIPAKPQNAKPFDEWNNTTILVYQGTVVHKQNGANVLEYHLWTQQWTDLLQKSKFSQDKWPLAFELLNNCGGPNHEGYIGLQDHGNDVWFRNIKIKIMD